MAEGKALQEELARRMTEQRKGDIPEQTIQAENQGLAARERTLQRCDQALVKGRCGVFPLPTRTLTGSAQCRDLGLKCGKGGCQRNQRTLALAEH